MKGMKNMKQKFFTSFMFFTVQGD